MTPAVARVAFWCVAALVTAAPAHTQTAPSQDEPEGIRVTGGSRPALLFPNGEIRLRGRLEGSLLTPTADEGIEHVDLGWQTRRLELEGTLFKRLEFEISREFGDTDEPERDAFLNYRLSRALELRGGTFKIPFGRDALAGGGSLDLVYRSLAGRQLAPGRDLGAMVHGRLFDRRLSYQAGYFGKDGDNARSPEMRGGRHAIAARAVITPMARSARPALAAFQIGVAVVSSRLDNQLGLRGKTVFGEGVFFDRVFVNGRRLRQGLEAAWAVGPVSLTWERSTVSDERGGMGAGGQRLADVRGAGWYVAGTWTLTGETKEGRVAPRRSVFNGGRGAFELAGRVERLAFDAAGGTMGGIEPAFNADRVLTAGLAWYLNRHLKVQSNLVLESILDPQHSPAPRGNGRMPRGVVQFQFVL